MNKRLVTRKLSASIAAILGASGSSGLTAAAHAQERPSEQLEEVYVTGTRIVQRDFTANSPVVSVEAAQFESSSAIAVEYLLNQLPQFVPAVTQFVTGEVQNSPTVTAGANTISLRGLGSNRNLVLIDGRRAQPVNALLTVDTNTIPSAAIQRVEVVTGGASATYGADAIAGVVNFILKKDFEGVELDIQTGATELGDGEETRIASLFGANFADGSGNVMLGLEYYERGVAPQAGREFYDLRNTDPTVAGTEGFGTNSYYLGGTNLPSQAAIDQIFSQATAGSVSRSTEFHFNRGDHTVYTGNDADGAYRYSDAGDRALGGGTFKRAADGTIDENQPFSYVSTPLDRYSLFGSGRFDVNDYVSVYGQANFVQTQNRTLLLWSPAVTIWNASIPYGTGTYAPSLQGDGTTHPDYLAGGRLGLDCPATGGCTNSQAFPVPAELATLLESRANPNDVWFLNRGMDYVGPRRTENTSQTFQTMVGLTGPLDGIDGNWDVYFSHGETDTTSELNGFGDLQNYRNIVQSPNFGRGAAINGPGGAGYGTSRCTTGLPIFEDFTPSADCISAVTANMNDLTFVSQDVAEVTAQGKLADYGPGEIRFAAGASYRKNDFAFETASLSSATNSASTVIGLFARNSTSGSTDVSDVFGEILLPVIADKRFIREMSLELGARNSDYSTGEQVSTYKALMNLEFGPIVRFRGGWQHANRAANIGELFSPDSQQVRTTSFGDACNQTNSTAQWGANPAYNPNYAAAQALCSELMGTTGAAAWYGSPRTGGGPGIVVVVERGNLTLGSEEADTRTAGLVLSPESFSVSVDFYDIDIAGAIGVEAYDTVYEQCLSLSANPTQDPNSPFCQRITRDQTTGAQQRVIAQYGNLGKFQTSGVDVQFNWNTTLRGGGGLGVSSLANWLNEYKTQDLPSAPLLENAGTGGRGGQFDYRLFNTVNYFKGSFAGSLRWRYYPALKHSSHVQNPMTTTQGSESYNIFDFNGRYTLSESYELRFGIDNVLDVEPPIYGATPTSSAQGTTLAGYYDTLGRRWFVGFKAQF